MYPALEKYLDHSQSWIVQSWQVEDLRSSANRRSYDASLILKWAGGEFILNEVRVKG